MKRAILKVNRNPLFGCKNGKTVDATAMSVENLLLHSAPREFHKKRQSTRGQKRGAETRNALEFLQPVLAICNTLFRVYIERDGFPLLITKFCASTMKMHRITNETGRKKCE